MSEPEITVRKLTAFMPISCCLLTDSTGVNHCQHEPCTNPRCRLWRGHVEPCQPGPPWHRRARWRLQSWWSGLRMRVGSWVAGVDLDEGDE